MQYSWPGNVRELKNACERIIQTCFCGTVGPGCLSFEMLSQSDVVPFAFKTSPAATIPSGEPTPIALDDRLRELESSLIQWALGASGGNKSKAAGLLKIRRSTFADRLSRCSQPEAGTDTAVDAAGSDAAAMPN